MNPDKYLPWIKALGVIVIALVIAYYVGSRTGKAKKEGAAEDLLKREIDKNSLTYEQTQYVSFADKLEQELNSTFIDENSIYSVFSKMRNKSDLIQLIKSFGMRRMKWYWGDSSLNMWINTKLETPEIATINDTLSRNSIDYQF